MVSIDLKSTYLQSLQKSELVTAFINFLIHDATGNFKLESFVDIENIGLAGLLALSNGNVIEFADGFAALTKRNPDSATPWLYNDFLMFILVCAIKKYELEKSWIESIIKKRKCESDSEEQRITHTFLNILNDNLKSTDNYQQVVAVYNQIMNVENPISLLEQLFVELWKMEFPFFKCDFLNVISLKSVELVVRCKGINNPEELRELRRFRTIFLQKSATLSKYIVNTIWISIIFLIFYYHVNHIGSNTSAATTIVGLIGFTVFEFIKLRSKAIKLVNGVLHKYWGIK